MPSAPQFDLVNLMLQMAKQARANAHAPYSKFKVGAALYTNKGKIFTGCNVENIAYPCGLCAEASAVANMCNQAGNQQIIKAIMVLTDTKDGTFPCGNCAQILSEFIKDDADLYICNLDGLQKHVSFRDSYPKVDHNKLAQDIASNN